MKPSQQASLVFIINLIVILAVLALLVLGYEKVHRISVVFWLLEGTACGLPLVAGSVDNWVGAARGDKQPQPQWIKNWIRQRDIQAPFFNIKGFLSFRGVIYVSTALSFAAMWILVVNTGGGIESPFAPLLVAPAILGPFIVRGKEALVLLLVIAVGVVFAEDLAAPKRASPPSTSLDHPAAWVYATVTLILVCSAVVISYVRMETEGPAWGLLRGWWRARRRGRVNDDSVQPTDGSSS